MLLKQSAGTSNALSEYMMLTNSTQCLGPLTGSACFYCVISTLMTFSRSKYSDCSFVHCKYLRVPVHHMLFSVPFQRWVFSLRLGSLATEQQSATRLSLCGDNSVGRDQHIAESGEIP